LKASSPPTECYVFFEKASTACGGVVYSINRGLEWAQLLAYYRTADIALITPLKDGMNLVAKEYCACSLEDGVLILSEFAGAAPQLQPDALLVNPNDVEGVADTIAQAWAMQAYAHAELAALHP
jgi:trehalose-6-phosphate synthase